MVSKNNMTGTRPREEKNTSTLMQLFSTSGPRPSGGPQSVIQGAAEVKVGLKYFCV